MLAFDGAFAPERVEERNERQAEDREIVALDLLEQLNAERLELIGADRAEDILASGDSFRIVSVATVVSAQTVSPLVARATAV